MLKMYWQIKTTVWFSVPRWNVSSPSLTLFTLCWFLTVLQNHDRVRLNPNVSTPASINYSTRLWGATMVQMYYYFDVSPLNHQSHRRISESHKAALKFRPMVDQTPRSPNLYSGHRPPRDLHPCPLYEPHHELFQPSFLGSLWCVRSYRSYVVFFSSIANNCYYREGASLIIITAFLDLLVQLIFILRIWHCAYSSIFLVHLTWP